MNWFMVGPPDNPMSIQLSAISYIAKYADGCRIRTVDGTDHFFHNISHEDMMARLSGVDA